MPLGTTIYYIIIAIIIGALFGAIIRILRYTSSRKKQNPVEQKLDKVIQLLEKQKLTLSPNGRGLLRKIMNENKEDIA